MGKNKSLAIIIPAYNEEKTILKVCRRVKNLGILLVIDDCSTDHTKNILKKNKIRFISNKSNIGYERSIKAGFKYVFKNLSYIKYFVTIDADLELPSKYISKLYDEIIKKKIDIIIGSRNKFNRFSENILNSIFKYKFHLTDPISGLKVYRVKVIKKIYNNISNKMFLVDILIIGFFKKFKISCRKIITSKRSGNPRVGGSIKINLKILKIAFMSLIHNKLNFN